MSTFCRSFHCSFFLVPFFVIIRETPGFDLGGGGAPLTTRDFGGGAVERKSQRTQEKRDFFVAPR